MKLVIQKIEQTHGVVTPPASKSQTIRALLLATLANGRSVLHNALESDDTETAIEVCRKLGADITAQGEALIIESSGVPLKTISQEINTRNSGITTRFIMPLLGLRKNSDKKIILNCAEQMKNRPVEPLITALSSLGLKIVCLEKDGHCPLEISGKLKGGEIKVDGLTSQYLSALLLSGSCVQGGLKVMVEDLHERPYIDMTLAWLDEQNINYKHYQMGEQDIFHLIGGQSYKPFEKNIPVDFSSASYLIAAGVLIPGKVVINNIDMNEKQGDKRLIEILKAMGADIKVQADQLLIRGGMPLYGRKISADDMPDLLPTLAVIGAYAQGETEIINVPQARIKETDRIQSLAEGLKAMGAKVAERSDGLLIKHSQLVGTTVKGYGDHRTVMALALAGLLAEGQTTVSSAEAINKTFPQFVETMNKLGCKIELIN